ncbi:hypothetical protein SKAU_G00040600 [Synaphobranchus kaupii]|uniref:Cadherin domain-containing protein n=1 Tax=Synaphobranchus kaupii TaxID=118154 RepID=A0A9Q1G177_SYNKA|nr:hypothetical protein SKAU_G00040600 [Synaphobranchus kaupii]
MCLGGQDIFATVRENSPPGKFVANLSITKDPGANKVRLCLTGDNADWFYLEGKSIRLNTSFSRVLDRELTAVNTVIFTVQARDADDDLIMYGIDTSSTDASYFRIDLPESGTVMLAKPLDYESRPRLQFVLYAVEMNTEEKYSTTANITVNVVDGDDLYPQFQPCTLLSEDVTPPVCTSPVYVVNVTEKEQDTILYFSPGPIHAVDGDRDLMTPLLYTILSGADDGRFRIDNETGEVVLTRRVEDRQLTPDLRLRIMFNRTAYTGFITESSSPATLVNTYGDEVLVIQAVDRDFGDGINPKLQYSLSNNTNNTGLYHITQEGHIIGKTNQLRAFEKHFLEVLATDQESGEVVNASINIDVLQKGQPVPPSPFGEGRLYGTMDLGTAGGVASIFLFLLAVVLFLFLQLARAKRRQDPVERDSVAPGKLHNTVNHGGAKPRVDELSYHNEAFAGYDASSSILQGKHGVYTRKGSMAHDWTTDRDHAPRDASPAVPTPPPRSASIVTKGRASNKSAHKSVWFEDEVTPEEKGVAPGDSIQRETEQENVHGDGVAQSPRELLFCQSNRMTKAEGGADRKDKSDSAKRGGEDTPPKRLKEQEANSDNGSNEENDVLPENPYKLLNNG